MLAHAKYAVLFKECLEERLCLHMRCLNAWCRTRHGIGYGIKQVVFLSYLRPYNLNGQSCKSWRFLRTCSSISRSGPLRAISFFILSGCKQSAALASMQPLSSQAALNQTRVS